MSLKFTLIVKNKAFNMLKNRLKIEEYHILK